VSQVEADGQRWMAGYRVASPTSDGRPSTRRLLLGLLVAIALVGCSADDEIRDADGTVINPGQISVFELEVGDCLDPGGEVSGEISEIDIVPCAEPHTQEVFGLVAHPDDDYPGASEVAAFADGACLTELETSLGLTLDDGVFFSYMLPTFDGWNADGEIGDRQIVCVLVFPDREAVSGSVVAGTADIERMVPQPPQDPADDEDEDQPDANDQGGA
jgi:hypothetical protein